MTAPKSLGRAVCHPDTSPRKGCALNDRLSLTWLEQPTCPHFQSLTLWIKQPWLPSSEEAGHEDMHLSRPPAQSHACYWAPLKPHPQHQKPASHWSCSPKIFSSEMMGELITWRLVCMTFLWKTRPDCARNQNISLAKSHSPVQNYLDSF